MCSPFSVPTKKHGHGHGHTHRHRHGWYVCEVTTQMIFAMPYRVYPSKKKCLNDIFKEITR